MNTTCMIFFTRSAEPNEPSLFRSLLQHYLPRAYPERFHRSEDQHLPFKEAYLAQFIDFWSTGMVFWDSQKPAIYGHAFLGNQHECTDILHTFDTALAPDDACCALLVELSRALRADYALLHSLPDDAAKSRPTDEMLGGATANNVRRWLPGIPWAACYGKSYVDLFGKENLLSLPIYEAREVGRDVVLCQLTSRLLDAVNNTELMDEMRKPVYERLGRDAFFDPQDPERQGRAPEFSKPVVARSERPVKKP